MCRGFLWAIVCAWCIVGFGCTVIFEDCGSTAGHFSKVIVTGCDTSKSACDLIRNTNVSLSIDFTCSKPVEEVFAKVYGVVIDVPIPFPLKNPNVCTDSSSGLKCPLEKDKAYTYTASLPVKSSYPRVSVTVKWELQTGKGEQIVCVNIPAKIK